MALIPDLQVIIPAGGAGTRLWPLSRAGHPKFLHDLTGAGRTLLQQTWDRLVAITAPGNITVVTGATHAAAVREQLPQLGAENLIAEPSPRDSMAAIGLAAAVLAQRPGIGPDVIVGSFAADHVVRDLDRFTAAIKDGVAAARQGFVTTIGLLPTGPSTAYGYIAAGFELGLAEAPTVRRVVEFVEKPDAATAEAYVTGGAHRWNAGMFLVRAGVLLDHLAQQRPDLHAGLVEIAAAWDTDRRDEVTARVWPTLEKIAIDHAVAEPVAAAGGVAVVPADFGWDDVGDWTSLAGLLPKTGADGARVLGDPAQVVALEAQRPLVVPAAGRKVVVLGIDDAVVVDTDDAILVTTRARAQEVKLAVDALRAAGETHLL